MDTTKQEGSVRNSHESVPSEETASTGSNDDSTEPVTTENRQGLLKVLTKAIGLDVTAITLPVTLNEPASFLMRLCEQIQYSDLLDKASQCEESTERLLYVSIFAASVFAVAERIGKPFNPLLGETFEYVDEKRSNLRCISEQVSHHPPIGAIHAENDNFMFWTSQQLKTKFTGNSLDCHSLGSSNVYLKKTNEHFRWHGLQTTVHNIIVGKVWLDHYGEMEVTNKLNGDKAKLDFTKCGWFSKGFHEVSGTIFDSNGLASYQLYGKWNESIFAKEINSNDGSSEGSPTASDNSKDKKKKDSKKEKKALKKALKANEPLWEHTNKPLESSKIPCKYMVDWTAHSLLMVELTDEMKRTLPPTDSRLRGDRLALEKSDTKKAAAEKHSLEEKQRAEAKARKTPWVPRYFKLSSEDPNDWEYLKNYWKTQ